jgi:hypothetical protein
MGKGFILSIERCVLLTNCHGPEAVLHKAAHEHYCDASVISYISITTQYISKFP